MLFSNNFSDDRSISADQLNPLTSGTLKLDPNREIDGIIAAEEREVI